MAFRNLLIEIVGKFFKKGFCVDCERLEEPAHSVPSVGVIMSISILKSLRIQQMRKQPNN